MTGPDATAQLGSWRMLVADIDPHIHRQLDVTFTGFGHHVRSVFEGTSVSHALASERYDVVVLATALGDGPDGLSVCRHLRSAGDRTPVIMLGEVGGDADVVAGLDAGADDFVSKPIRLAELRSRIKALLRRERGGDSNLPLRLGHVVLDHSAREVRCDAQPVSLTYTEYEVLLVLMSRADCVCTRTELLHAARGSTTFTDPRSIDVYIHHLRLKLERDPTVPTLIQTVRGVGYKAAHVPVALGGA